MATVTTVRVGTWNMEGHLDQRHSDLLDAQDCQVWLLTEVPVGTEVRGLSCRATSALIKPDRYWAAVYAAEGEALPSPHPANAVARLPDGWTCASSVLPWRGSGRTPPWSGETHEECMRTTLEAVEPVLPEGDLVWGGDWNQALQGEEHAGSKAGRRALTETLTRLGLHVPTATLGHPLPGLFTIDHVAWAGTVTSARQVVAEVDGERLSDHDAYVVDLVRPA